MVDDRSDQHPHVGVVMTGDDGVEGRKAFYILIEALPARAIGPSPTLGMSAWRHLSTASVGGDLPRQSRDKDSPARSGA
jgi:hypothetical protein